MKSNKSHILLKILILLLIVHQVFTSNAQGYPDSLAIKFAEAKTDSSKMKAFEVLFMHNIVRNYEKSKTLLGVIDSLCTVVQYKECDAFNKLYNGFYYRVTGSFDTSLLYFQESYNLFEKNNNYSKMGVCSFNSGVVNSYLGNYDKATEKYFLAREYYEKSGNTNGIVNVHNSLGIIYKNLKDYDKAHANYLQASKLAEEINSLSMQAMVNNNLANLFYQQEVYADSVILYGKKALKLETKLGRNTGIASAHNLLSGAYLDKQDKDMAIQESELAVEYARKSGNKRFISIHEMGHADVLKKTGNLKLGEDFYISSLALADSIELRDQQVHGFKNYSELLTQMGRYKDAYAARLAYEAFKDSLDVQESKSKIAELETKYELAIKDKNLEEQKAETNKKTYQRNLISGGFVLSILLGGSMIWGLMSRSRKNKKISIQEKKLQSQKIETLEQEKKLLSMSSLLEGQENERIRIAKDLHDGLGGLLTTVKAHFSKIQSEIEKVENLDIYTTANEMIDKAHDEVRRISHNLMPADLRAGGLPVAVRQLVHELKTIHDTNTDFDLIGFNDGRIDEKVELSVYRITQELINNVLKYAKADQVFIQLSKFEKEVQIVVEDNGIGFDYNKALSESNGLGLKSILSRVEKLKGQMDVVSSRGKGTSVTINIPI